MQRVNSLEKTLMLGKTEGKRMSCLNSVTDTMAMSLSKLWKTMKDRKPGALPFMGLKELYTT